MAIKFSKFVINSNGNDVIDITEKVKAAILKYGVYDALINIHAPFSSSSIGVFEYTPDTVEEFLNFSKKIIKTKNHHHIKSLIVGNSATVPFIGGEFELDRFQRILLLDFDNKKRARSVIIQIIY